MSLVRLLTAGKALTTLRELPSAYRMRRDALLPKFGTGGNPSAARVYLNLAPGVLKVTDVLRVLVEATPIEAAEVMQPAEGPEPPIFAEFREMLGPSLPLQPLGRFEFYDAARHRDTALVIATGEQRIYANLLLTIGVVMP